MSGYSADQPIAAEAPLARALDELVGATLRRQREEDRWEIEDRLAAMEAARIQMTATGIQRRPTVSANPVGPATSLILALGGVLGLMLGVFAAFMREFLVKAREYREALQAESS